MTNEAAPQTEDESKSQEIDEAAPTLEVEVPDLGAIQRALLAVSLVPDVP